MIFAKTSKCKVVNAVKECHRWGSAAESRWSVCVSSSLLGMSEAEGQRCGIDSLTDALILSFSHRGGTHTFKAVSSLMWQKSRT